jgi:hypothetical protein
MSDTSQGPGWWLASDGRWYPPEAWTGTLPPVGPTPFPTGGPVPYGTPPVVGGQTNGLAVASLACACAGVIPFLFGLPCILGIIFGFVSRSQIRRARGAQGGAGLALAGIIVGFCLIGIFILAVALVAAFGHGHFCIGESSDPNCSRN